MTAIENNQKGSAAVEFALCLPFLILIFGGILEYGWYLTNQIVLLNAASAGARAGIKAKYWEDENPAEFAQFAAKNAFWINSLSKVNVDIIEDSQFMPRGIQVSASFEYLQLTGLLPSKLIPEFVKAKAVMVFP